MKKRVQRLLPKLLTASLVIAACVSAYLLYSRWKANPWTRNAQLLADVVQITPQVGGYLVNVAVQDNQSVKKGDLLFQIDPSEYELAVDQAKVELDQAREEVSQLEAAVRAAEAVVSQRETATRSAESQIDAANAAVESAESMVTEAEAGVTEAEAAVTQMSAQLDEASRQAERAQKLSDAKAGSLQTAQAKEASRQSYVAGVKSAEAGLKQAEAAVAKARAAKREAEANRVIAENGLAEAKAGVLAAEADLDQAKANLGAAGDANVRIRTAQVKLQQAELDLKWTSIHAPADGYISNMSLLESTYVSPGTPFALFVDASTFRVEAYFQETKLKHIRAGDRAVVTLMGRKDRPFEAEVDSIGYAIKPPNLAQTDGPANIVPTIEPTFEWIRLAQRIPVKIRLKEKPEDVYFVSGMTASVAIKEEPGK